LLAKLGGHRFRGTLDTLLRCFAIVSDRRRRRILDHRDETTRKVFLPC
jgi:hypothetical protein